MNSKSVLKKPKSDLGFEPCLVSPNAISSASATTTVLTLDQLDPSFPIFQHDDGCKDFVTSLCTQNLMQSALGLSGNNFGLRETSILFVTRQLTELILTNGFKKVKKPSHVPFC